jgi:hypothetical protein
MIEVYQDLYMEEESGCMSEDFFRLHMMVEEILNGLLHRF